MGKMSPDSFCYWLQGFMEAQNPEALDCTQTQIIKDHLNEVFDKVTPIRETQHDGFKKLDVKPDSKRKKINIDSINNFPHNQRNGPLLLC